jgi:hypothetical protein
MEIIMKSSCVLHVLLFASVTASFGQSPGTTKPFGSLEQTLRASESNLIAAKRKDDVVFFKRTLAANFSLVEVDGKLLEGAEAKDNLGDSHLVELTPYDMKVVAAGDDVAIVTYDAIVGQAPQEDQESPPRYQHFSSVWVKQGGQWKLEFHQATAAHWGDW